MSNRRRPRIAARLRRPVRSEQRDAVAQWTGPSLREAVLSLAPGDVAHARALAFAVAQAIREGHGDALPALTRLLAEVPMVAATDEGTLMNVLSALQFASMLADDAHADWVPANDSVAKIVDMGLTASGTLPEQAEGLLWALIDRRLAADWLGPEAGAMVVGRVASLELRKELLSSLNMRLSVGVVADGGEFPCVPA